MRGVRGQRLTSFPLNISSFRCRSLLFSSSCRSSATLSSLDVVYFGFNLECAMNAYEFETTLECRDNNGILPGVVHPRNHHYRGAPMTGRPSPSLSSGVPGPAGRGGIGSSSGGKDHRIRFPFSDLMNLMVFGKPDTRFESYA